MEWGENKKSADDPQVFFPTNKKGEKKKKVLMTKIIIRGMKVEYHSTVFNTYMNTMLRMRGKK